ncbi:MAG: hypothetical protein RLZZ319_636 [Actinomycetota bacterium]|jgi:hypothetical protein
MKRVIGVFVSVVAGSIALAGCSLFEPNHLTAEYTGDFTLQDCRELMGPFLGQSPDDLAVKLVCKQQFDKLGQEGFNTMMHDSIVGLIDYQDTIDQMTGDK